MVTKAELRHIKWKANKTEYDPGDASHTVVAHFNPETLKVTFENKSAGGEQPGGSSRQRTGNTKTKLAVELLFDTTNTGADVRKLTEKVSYFIQPDAEAGRGADSNRVPPAVLFAWGSFLFPGVVDSMDETLDYFSEEGVPLRATISLGITRQAIKFFFNDNVKAGGAGAPLSLEQVKFNDTVQAVAARNGNPDDWKKMAAANNIDDPLRLSAGALINVNASVGISAGAGLSASAGFSAGASAGFSASAGVSASAGASLSGGALAQASTSAGVSARSAASAQASAQASASAGGALSAGGSASASASLTGGASARVGSR
jgi:contractile injection system tube protein